MSTLNMLYKQEYAVNDYVHVVIPSVGEILDDEDNYYNLVSMLTAMPIDYMVQLDDAGIDFTKINEYELFLILFEGIKTADTHLIFGDLNLMNFNLCENKENNTIVLFDKEDNICIDRVIHDQIAAVLRKIHHLKKNRKRPANEEAKDYMLKRAREKLRRRANSKNISQLESLIIAMVNTEQYKYDFEGTRELSIYQFNESVRQVIKKIDYDNTMHGIYAGTINPKDLSRDDLDWLTHK